MLVSCLVGFMVYQTFSGHLIPNYDILIKVSNTNTVFVYTQLNVKKIPFQSNQFSISTNFSSISSISSIWSLLSATNLAYSGPRRDGNDRVLCIR